MNPAQLQQQKFNLATTALSQDGTQVVQTFTKSYTQAELTMALAQAQTHVANLTQQLANANANISSIQTQLGLFAQTAITVTPVTTTTTPGA